MKRLVRSGLVLIALVFAGLFVVAARLDPYQGGRVWYEETHRQLGLPECTFKKVTGLPCPSCGMSTSFALLVRGDVWNSLQANAAGTLLALFLAALIPWSLVSALRGRLLFVRSGEWMLVRVVSVFLFLVLARWAIVLLMSLWTG